jgi:D-cysteine desulfhydrase family pyridoxal phosphate-dependent enzyme
MSLNQKKISFLNAPTPVEYLPAISKELGVEFYIKRDDLTNLGVGGNKLRKLEYLLADALDQGATRLLTLGGAQTNHGRLTAAVAAKYGLKCTIACIDNYPGELSANLLLDRMMGADVVLKKDDGRDEGLQFDELAAELTAKYEANGEKVYFIPIGGSSVVGMAGYYDCATELTAQAKEMGLEDARVICGVGSIGTFMGLYCGLKNEGSPLGLTGVAISPFGDAKEARIMKYFADAKAHYGLTCDATRADFDIEKDYTRGAYNNPCKEVREAMYLMASKEAIILDPCYTGKVFAGIIDMVKAGKIKQGEKIIMLHTGGLPGIYTKHHRVEFEKELLDGVTILD